MPPILQASAITKSFSVRQGSLEILEPVDFALEPGQFVSIQGASGSGKSTLLLILGGLLRPDSGTVTLCGHDLFGCSGDRRAALRARQIGFVFQRFHLLPYLTVRQNMACGGVALGQKIPDARIEELLQRFDLVHRADHLPGRLSVGEQQRTALGRALLHRPALLLADEPTGNLDPANAEIVLEAMEDFVADGGAAVLVTHQPDCAARADRSFRIANRRLVASDPAPPGG